MKRSHTCFSIIVPTFRRPVPLAACLRGLAGLAYPRDRFEVIVVDDGSPRPPREVIASFRETLDVTLLCQPHAGPATARNAGAARARGRFLAFTDDDCAPDPHWLEALEARFSETPDHLVGGRTVNALARNPYAEANELRTAYLYHYYHASPGARGSQPPYFATNNLALPAERFRAIGGFDPRFPRGAAEDREFCDRWLHRGFAMMYAPEVLVSHAHALTLGSYWRQHCNYGRGACLFHQARTGRGEGPIRIEPWSFYRGLLQYPFAAAGGRRALLLAMLIGLSQVANAAGFFREKAVCR